jgi:uncharacterized phage infection (PIP) family protein YhgE
MSESTEQLRKAATAAAKDVKKLADKHLPALRRSTKAVIDRELPRVKSELPKVAAAVRDELPKYAEAVRKQFTSRKPR